MHYSKLKLRNFMCYEDVEVDLKPGLNVIIGQTDSGKSTLLRALSYVMYNKIPSTIVVREGEDETSATILTSAGHEISRIRNPKVNAYKFDEQYYTAIGSSVPPEVSLALGVTVSDEKGAEQLQYSRQLDGPFLLSLGGSSAAKILGSLCGISVFDDALSDLKSDITKLRRSMDSLVDQENAYAASLIDYSGLPSIEQSVMEIADTIGLLDKEIGELAALRRIVRDLEELNSPDIDVISIERELDSLVVASDDLIADIARRDLLISLCSNMADYNHNLSKVSADIVTYDRAVVSGSEELKSLLNSLGICPVCGQGL